MALLVRHVVKLLSGDGSVFLHLPKDDYKSAFKHISFLNAHLEDYSPNT